MGLTILVTQPVSIFRAKLWKVVVKYEILCFLTFEFFSKCTFLRLRHFISCSTYPFNSFFSEVVWIYKNHVFDEAFFLLAIVAMITEKMYFSYFHGNICKRKIPLLNHTAYQSSLSLEKMESDKVY